jgi:hypothetical protein
MFKQIITISLFITLIIFAFAHIGCQRNAQSASIGKTDSAQTQAGSSDRQASDEIDVKKLYKIAVLPLSIARGEQGQAAFNVLTVAGAKVHPQAPFSCKISATPGFKLQKTELEYADTKVSKDERTLTVPVGITAQQTGDQRVTMDCSFFVCTDEICARTEEVVHIATNVR